MVKAKDAIDTGRVTGRGESGFGVQEREAGSSRIKRDIDQTRAEMDQTVNALAEELSPRHLLDSVLDLFRGESGKVEVRRIAQQAGSKALATIRKHPVPSTLVGAGIFYLLLVEDKEKSLLSSGSGTGAGVRPDVDMSAFLEETDLAGADGEAGKPSVSGAAAETKDTMAQAAHSAGVALSSAAGTVRDVAARATAKAGDLTGKAGEMVRHAGHNVRTGVAAAGQVVKAKAIDAAQQARHGYDAGRDKAAEVFEEYPLAVGAAIVGLGVLAGLAFPRTRSEDEILGEQADRLKRRGREALDRGIQVAQVTAEETIDEAKRQGLTASAIGEKAKRIAAEITDKATEAAQREEATPEQIGDKVKAVAERAKEAATQEIEQQSNLQESNV